MKRPRYPDFPHGWSALALLALLSSVMPAAEVFDRPPLSRTVLTFALPGIWFVAQGGDTPNVNDHMAVQNQMYGLDLVKCGGGGARELCRGDGKKVDDFYSWGQPVLCPANGTVHAVTAGAVDNPLGTRDELNPYGNYVAITLASGETLVLAHFQQGSLRVTAGAAVHVGDTLGVIGNSGNSDFPHLHLHVQLGDGITGHGVVPVFHNPHASVDGVVLSDAVLPLIRGMFLGTPP